MGNARKWSQEEIDFIRENSAMPMAEISSILNRPLKGIESAYYKFKIPRSLRRRFTEEEQDFIATNFNSMTNAEIGRKLNVKSESIATYLCNRGLKREKENKVFYFDKPITEEYAYILGWLFSDGFLFTKTSTFGIAIVQDDAIHIDEYLMNLYPWSKRTFFREKYPNFRPQWHYSTHRQDIAEYIKSTWDFDQKSYRFPEKAFNIINQWNDGCKRCFLRGFFDGDGYVRRCRAHCSITKRIDFDWTFFLQLIPSNIEIKWDIKNTEKSKGCSLKIYKDAPLFFQYIYNTNFKACLPRKKDIVLAHFEKPYYRDKYGPLMEEV